MRAPKHAGGTLRRRLAGAPWLACLILMGGCDVLPKLGGPPANLYTLTPKSTFSQQLAPVHYQLVVEEPVAAGGLNTDRIALRTRPTEVKYFARAKWTERAPRMIQTLLVESFENSGRIVAVGRKAIGLRSDYNVKSELREFQAEYFNGTATPTVRIRLNVKMVKQPRRNIIASRNFEAKVTAGGTEISQVIDAFDEALGKVLRQVVEWTLQQG